METISTTTRPAGVSSEAPAASSEAVGAVVPVNKPALVGLSLEELGDALRELGEPAFRAKQLYGWLYQRRAFSFDEMANVPKGLRQRLAERFDILPLEEVSRRESQDGSVKYLFRCKTDGALIESVLMPDRERVTLCVSSQVGCGVDCQFCLTGKMGFQRNLTAGEILGQVLWASRHDRLDHAARDGRRRLTNIVFMGMGEPLLNFRNVEKAIREMTRQTPESMGLSPRRITVSTAGVIPGIEALGASGLGVNLAVSLNAPTDEQRDKIMPINRSANIERLLEAVRAYPLPPTRRITFEYVLLAGQNDSPDDARKLAKLVQGIPCKVNIIPFNPGEGLPFERPAPERVDAFGRVLRDADLTVSVRWSKGLDADAACGQLATDYRREKKAGKRADAPAS
jgi:23S rRNA (adenine2503-C2)-methyltransferase